MIGLIIVMGNSYAQYIVSPALLLSGCALTQQSTPIQPDANWHVNQLSNGMKYHIYPTQDQEVSVRLVMHIGSFQEEANQRLRSLR